ncbi:hypothetical protein GCM10027217_03410 [Pseudomaricurvus hydrocarbonicus]
MCQIRFVFGAFDDRMHALVHADFIEVESIRLAVKRINGVVLCLLF